MQASLRSTPNYERDRKDESHRHHPRHFPRRPFGIHHSTCAATASGSLHILLWAGITIGHRLDRAFFMPGRVRQLQRRPGLLHLQATYRQRPRLNALHCTACGNTVDPTAGLLQSCGAPSPAPESPPNPRSTQHLPPHRDRHFDGAAPSLIVGRIAGNRLSTSIVRQQIPRLAFVLSPNQHSKRKEPQTGSCHSLPFRTTTLISMPAAHPH